MTRITIVDVRRVLNIYSDVLTSMGVDTTGLTLRHSSGHYSLTGADGSPAPGVVGHGMSGAYIGSTAAEAYTTIITISKALEFAKSLAV